ncbi:MAG TPA: hypothetical protein VML55_26905 [Planctomycetaceae bacterium]|nr:hypothetical protein [Planctomycetaceae bacterium]
MYEQLPPGVPLSQGDVIDGCPVFQLDPASSNMDLEAQPEQWRMRVIVMTQACDLTHVKTPRVLVAVMHSAQELVETGEMPASLIRDQIRRGRVFGAYFLPAAPAPLDLPESIVDLRDLHTVSRTVLEHLIQAGKRLCRLITPYREHLAQHFAVTYMRIGLPEPYETEP